MITLEASELKKMISDILDEKIISINDKISSIS